MTTIGSLFSGYGGLDLAVEATFGATTAWVSDIDKGANKILAHRHGDLANLGDIAKINWSGVERVDILTGGFPCQDVSHAGKRQGLRPGNRSGLWTQMAYAIDQLRPRLVVIENVRGLLSAKAHSDVEPCPVCLGDRAGSSLRALGAVLGGLAELGYDAQWHGLRAAEVGAPHGRYRVFVVAYPQGEHGIAPRTERLAMPDAGLLDLLPTPDASAHKYRLGGNTQQSKSLPAMAIRGELALLPTPNPFHSTNSETPQEWLERRAEVQERTGTRHGPALGVVAQSIEQGAPLVQDGSGPRLVETSEQFGVYGPAVARWAAVLDRSAPPPTEPARVEGARRLSAAFVEWMMGLPAGWVTDVPDITRNQALKALGNGVVPQQAEAALRDMLGVATTAVVA